MALLATTGTVVLTIFASPAAADDGSPPNDRVTAYATEAEIHPDGTVSVTESITYDFGTVPSPGISREIPLTLGGAGLLQERRVEVDDMEVTSQTGADTTIDGIDERRGSLVILVGAEDDPSTDVTGVQTYDISYTVSGALTSFDDYDELYWNFVGTEWGVPITDITVEVTAPEIINVDCYAGSEGSQRDCRQAEHDDTVASFAHPLLIQGQGLTVAVTLPPGAVEVGEPILATRTAFVPSPIALAGLALALLVILGGIGYRLRAWIAARRYSPELPSGLTPALAALVLARGRLTPQPLLAMLVDLERRGVVSSEAKPGWSSGALIAMVGAVQSNAGQPGQVRGMMGEWEFTLRGDPRDLAVSAAERVLLDCMFSQGPTTNLGRLTASMTSSRIGRIRAALRSEAHQTGLLVPRGCFPLSIAVVAGCFGLAMLGVVLLVVGTPGALLAIPALLVAAIAAAALLRFPVLSPYGAHVRKLLRVARHDTMTGGPRSMADDPAWTVAVGVSTSLITGGGTVLPHHQAQGFGAHHQPYYYDGLFQTRWSSSLGNRINPSGSSGGGGGGGGGHVGGGGSFGGGNVGGGGGGGGGGRR